MILGGFQTKRLQLPTQLLIGAQGGSQGVTGIVSLSESTESILRGLHLKHLQLSLQALRTLCASLCDCFVAHLVKCSSVISKALKSNPTAYGALLDTLLKLNHFHTSII